MLATFSGVKWFLNDGKALRVVEKYPQIVAIWCFFILATKLFSILRVGRAGLFIGARTFGLHQVSRPSVRE